MENAVQDAAVIVGWFAFGIAVLCAVIVLVRVASVAAGEDDEQDHWR